MAKQIINGDIELNGAVLGSAENIVFYSKEQTLTDAQKEQARDNIGAISSSDLPTMPDVSGFLTEDAIANMLTTYYDVLSKGEYSSGLKIATGYKNSATYNSSTYSAYSYADIYVPYMTNSQWGVAQLSLPYKADIAFSSSYDNGYYGITRKSQSPNLGQLFAYIRSATSERYGTVMLGDSTALTIGEKVYGVGITSDGKLAVSVPWEDTNTTFTLGHEGNGSGNVISGISTSGSNVTYSYSTVPTYEYLAANYMSSSNSIIDSYMADISQQTVNGGMELTFRYANSSYAYSYILPKMNETAYGVARVMRELKLGEDGNLPADWSYVAILKDGRLVSHDASSGTSGTDSYVAEIVNSSVSTGIQLSLHYANSSYTYTHVLPKMSQVAYGVARVQNEVRLEMTGALPSDYAYVGILEDGRLISKVTSGGTGGGVTSGNYVEYLTNGSGVSGFGPVHNIQVVTAPGNNANTLYIVV